MATSEELRTQANDIIKYHANSAGFRNDFDSYADMAAVVGVQVNLIRELAKLYSVPFEKEYVRAAIAGVMGGGLPFAASATPVIASSLKAIPFVGQVLGAIIMPGFSTVTSLALGRLFLRHFEAGGNLLNLNIPELRKHFVKECEAAKQEAKDLVPGKELGEEKLSPT